MISNYIVVKIPRTVIYPGNTEFKDRLLIPPLFPIFTYTSKNDGNFLAKISWSDTDKLLGLKKHQVFYINKICINTNSYQ